MSTAWIRLEMAVMSALDPAYDRRAGDETRPSVQERHREGHASTTLSMTCYDDAGVLAG